MAFQPRAKVGVGVGVRPFLVTREHDIKWKSPVDDCFSIALWLLLETAFHSESWRESTDFMIK